MKAVSKEAPRQMRISAEPVRIRHLLESEIKLLKRWIRPPKAVNATKVRQSGIDAHSGARADQQSVSLADKFGGLADGVVDRAHCVAGSRGLLEIQLEISGRRRALAPGG